MRETESGKKTVAYQYTKLPPKCEKVYNDSGYKCSYSVFVTKCVMNYYDSSYMIYTLTNSVSGRIYIGFVQSYETLKNGNHKCYNIDTLTDLIPFVRNYSCRLDIKNYGIGSMTLNKVGYFKDLATCMKMYSMLLNDYMDRDYKMYNDDVAHGSITRVLSFPVELPFHNALVLYCIKKKITVSHLFKKLVTNKDFIQTVRKRIGKSVF